MCNKNTQLHYSLKDLFVENVNTLSGQSDICNLYIVLTGPQISGLLLTHIVWVVGTLSIAEIMHNHHDSAEWSLNDSLVPSEQAFHWMEEKEK